MYKLTDRRKIQAKEILDRYSQELHDSKSMRSRSLERELRGIWGIGYQETKDIMVDILLNHKEYTHLAVYYMEHSNAPGVVTEFKRLLAEHYGLTSWDHDKDKESKRAAYWEDAFAWL